MLHLDRPPAVERVGRFFLMPKLRRGCNRESGPSGRAALFIPGRAGLW